MLSKRLRARLDKDRPMTSITLRIPVDVVESMKAIAPLRGFSGYHCVEIIHWRRFAARRGAICAG